MIQLDIDEAGVAILREVLDSARSDLKYEISNTDSKDYREQLRVKQALLEKVIEQLG